jgi:cob(I)alamin adenosyltransferase
MKIYTKTGDKGETGLFGGGRVAKDSLRIEAYGTVDELNSHIGLALTEVKDKDVKKLLEKIQNQLFALGSDLATPEEKFDVPRITKNFYEEIENSIDHFESRLDDLKHFILPGGSKSASLLHICRTITRRAERRAVSLSKKEKISEDIIIYLNRLSDLFFVLSRVENKAHGITDTKWIP